MKDIRDYLPYYVGSPVFLCNNLEGNPVIEPLTSKMLHEDEEMFTDPAVGPWRLMLRRLSDMAEEEMLGLLQTMVPDEMEDKPDDDDYSLKMFQNDGGNMVDRNVAVGAEYTCICFIGQITIKECGTICAYDESGDEQELVNAPRAYRYLLKKGFDIFNLIDAGLAIDAQTTTP